MNLADLKLLIEVRVADFCRAFEAEPETIRRALLGEGRISVREDAERRFALEGWLSLPLMQQTPGSLRTPGVCNVW